MLACRHRGLGRYRGSRQHVAAAFTPVSLFSGGKDGVLFDLQQTATLFSDSAMTTQAVVGGTLGAIADISGNNHPATQATSTAQPVLQQSGGVYYLDPDGVEDRLSMGNILPFGTQSFSVVFVIDRLASVNENILSRRGEGGTGTNPGWGVRLNSGNSLLLEFDDGIQSGAWQTLFSFAFPSGLSVCTVLVDRELALITCYINSTQVGTVDISAYGDVSGTNELTIGAPVGNLHLQSNFYGGLIIAGALSKDNRLKTEQWFATRAGIAL